MSEVLESMLRSPGLYIGRGTTDDGKEFVARAVLRILPSRTAVAMQYEAFSADQLLQHAEETIISYQQPDQVRLWVTHSESTFSSLLRPSKNGLFTGDDIAGLYELAVKLELNDGELTYEWWWATRGQQLKQRSTATLHRQVLSR